MCHLICRLKLLANSWQEAADSLKLQPVPPISTILITATKGGAAILTSESKVTKLIPDTLLIDDELFFEVNSKEIEVITRHEKAHQIWYALPEHVRDAITTYWFGHSKKSLETLAEKKLLVDSASTIWGKYMGHPQANEQELFASVFTAITFGATSKIPDEILNIVEPYALTLKGFYEKKQLCKMWGK